MLNNSIIEIGKEFIEEYGNFFIEQLKDSKLYSLLEKFTIRQIVAYSVGIYIASLGFRKSISFTQYKIRNRRQFKGVASPPEHFLGGHDHHFAAREDLPICLRKWHEQYDGLYKLQFGFLYTRLSLGKAKYAKDILNSSGKQRQGGSRAGDILLLGNKWRRAIKNGQDGKYEMFQNISLMTLDSLLKCIFGITSNCQMKNENHPYLEAIRNIAECLNVKFHNPILMIHLLFCLTPTGWRYYMNLNRLHSFTRKVIADKKSNLSQPKKTKFIDFIDILLSARDEDGKGMTDKEIAAEVDTFMFEGHDTTASGISFALYNLARYPEIQERCRAEVMEVMGSSDNISWNDLPKLTYLTNTLKESMRVHAPVPIIAREMTQDRKLCNGLVLKKGTAVSINMYSIHMDDEVWEEPMKFDPDRFADSTGRHPYAFVPFAAGPRNCIGQNFALAEMKTTLAIILKNFRLKPINDPKIIFDLVLRSSNGINVQDEDGNGLTDKEIAAEVDSFMFAVHDTTASALSFALYNNLAEHPQIQEKDDLSKLTYLTNSLKESLRINPPISVIARQLDKDRRLENGMVLPKGMAVDINIAAIHKDPDVWDELEKFNPSRFDKTNDRHPYAFTPFSAGPRNCIGQHFALAEMKTSLAIILKNFRLKPLVDPIPIIDIVLNSSNGINIQVERLSKYNRLNIIENNNINKSKMKQPGKEITANSL
ncbi:DgyrCDS9679 [Dimorphilus gyrociliatus]|uniref:DgyrCDS9679 n=1 Tax=Dimorphilus gyrociliatus TaxID=2664684 RepID=A0A7I8VXQ6_9ANNE|nr:DgyrCDS9679 [Dimorphilus gyrociliatus]